MLFKRSMIKWKERYILVLAAMIIAIMGINSFPSKATEVGNVVKASQQVEFEGAKYPEDGATITEVASITPGETVVGSCVLYSDGTVVLLGNEKGEVGGKKLSSQYTKAFKFTNQSAIRTIVYSDTIKIAYSDLFSSSASKVIFNSDGYVTSRQYDSYTRYGYQIPSRNISEFIFLKPFSCSDSSFTYTILNAGVDTSIRIVMGEDIKDWPDGLFPKNVCGYTDTQSLTVEILGDGSKYSTAFYRLSSLTNFTTVGDYVKLGVNASKLETVNSEGIKELPDNFIKDAKVFNLTKSKLPESGLKRVGSFAMYNVPINSEMDLSTVIDIGESAYQGSSLVGVPNLSSVVSIGQKAFTSTKITEATVYPVTTIVGQYAFSSNLNLTKLVYSASAKFDSSMVNGCTSLEKLYILSPIDASMNKSLLPATAMIYCEAGSAVETWCKNNSVAYKTLTDEEIEELRKGQVAKLGQDSKLFDFENPADLAFTVDLGKKPAGASDVKKVLVDNRALVKGTDYAFNGTDTITIYGAYLKTLYNGTHAVSVMFDNGTFKSGASIYVMSSTVPVIDPTKPPEALDTVKYEFYKDYPDYVIIPVSLNGATKVTELKIGSEVVDPAYYELEDGAIIISYNYLMDLDPGKYRVLPTFNDLSITTLNNIQLLVYNEAADRAAPYLLQSRIVFKGQNFSIKFDAGAGDLEASNVLALVVDNHMLLPDGRLLPFSTTNVSKVKKSYADDVVASPSEAAGEIEAVYTVTQEDIYTASPSEATQQTMSLMSSFMGVMVSQPAEAFYVVDNEIHVSGDVISSMKLSEGDHLMGAIFDNTEKTTDIRKVILSIMSDKADNGTENPGNNETPGNNDNGGSNNGGNSGNGGNSSGGNSGNGSHGSGSGGSGSGDNSNGPGAVGEDSKSKPDVRDDGGSYTVNPNDPKDVTYTDKGGNLAPNKWVGDGQNWRHTNKDSKLDYGWFLDKDGNWYLLTKESGKDFGTARYGWFYETQDDKWYYLSTKDNKMVKGKVKIDGKEYYFNESNEEPTYYGNNEKGWIYDKTKPGLPVGCWKEAG